MKYVIIVAILTIASGLYGQADLATPQSLTDSSVNETITELQRQVKELEEKGALTWLWGIGGGLIGALIGFAFTITLKSQVEKKAAQLEMSLEKKATELERILEKTANEETHIAAQTFGKVRSEEQLKNAVKFKIIGSPIGNGKLYRTLQAGRFNLSNITEGNDFNVLLINNQGGSFASKKESLMPVVDLINKLNNEQVAFYFNDTRVPFPNESINAGRQDRLNFANNASQIYGNLVNSLIYQHSLVV